LIWDDLTDWLPGSALYPSESTQVLVEFTAITSTQHLSPPVTINTAVSEGTLTDAGELPRQEDDAEVGIEAGGDTPIVLLYLRANPKADDILIEWATLLEIDTYGFWLYRGQDDQLSHAAPVAFVPAKGGSGAGASYQYLDTEVSPGLYHYWLVEVDNEGVQTAYGPISAWAGLDVADLPYQLFLPLVRRE
jgi:hypothetical protein